jgi:hypothetical protein
MLHTSQLTCCRVVPPRRTSAAAAGLAVAERLGAPYPFAHDKLAAQQVCVGGGPPCWHQQRWKEVVPWASLQTDPLPSSPGCACPQFDTYLSVAHGLFVRRAKQQPAAAGGSHSSAAKDK